MRLFGSGERLYNMVTRLGLDEDTPISARILSSSIETAQKRIEANNFERRKNVLTYDDVMNQQRSIIYAQRHEVLTKDDIKDKIINMIRSSVSETFDFCFGVDTPCDWKFDEFKNHYLGLVKDKRNFEYTEEELEKIDKESWKEELIDAALKVHEDKEKLFKSIPEIPENAFREVEKVILLQNVDKKWMDHLEAMDQLKEYIGLNSYAQRDPVAMYRLQGADLFEEMVDDIKEDTVRQILTVMPKLQSTERVQVAKPTSEGFVGKGTVSNKPAVSKKVGRNDPCPCGSGKKYKKCCGQNESAE
jgi:preprotein translocase subunit SecA